MHLINNKKTLIPLLFFFTLFINFSIFAQKDNDSLNYYLSIIENKQKTLSVDSLVLFYQKAREFSDEYYQIFLLRKEATSLVNLGYKNTSYNRLVEAQLLAEENNFPVAKILVNNGFSYYYYHFNQFTLSYQALLESKNQLERITEIEIENYNRYNKHTLSKQDIQSTIINNIGTIALLSNKIDKAESYFKESLKASIRKNDTVGIIDAKINIATILYSRKQFPEAIKILDSIRNTYKLNKSDLSLIYYNISMNYADMDRISKADFFIDKAISFSEEMKDRIMLVDLYFYKSQIENSKKNYKRERFFLLKSIDGALSIEDTEGLIDFYKAMASSENHSANYNKAITWYEKLEELQDSLRSDDNENVFNKIETENNLIIQQQKNKHQSEVLKNEREKANLYGLILILTLFIIVGLFLLWRISKKNSYKRMKIEIQRRKIIEIEIKNAKKLQKVEREKIQGELNIKKRELLVSLLFIKKRKEKLKSINNEIDKMSSQSLVTKAHLKYLKKFIIDKSIELEKEENIQQQLVNVHQNFFNKLLIDFPDLTKTELKVLAYLRVGMSTKEIAEFQFVSIDAVRKSRYRIRKKLHLSVEDSLEKFILKYH